MKRFLHIPITIIIFAMLLSMVIISCKAEAEVSVTWDFSWTLPDCAPSDAKVWAARVDKFTRGAEAQLEIYKNAIGQLYTLLGLSGKTTADDQAVAINDFIKNSVQVICKYELTFTASAEFTGTANVDNDEASMAASTEFKASYKMTFTCDTNATAPFNTADNLAKIRDSITNLKIVYDLAKSLKLKNEYLAANGVDTILASIKNVTSCPQMLAKIDTITKEFTDAYNKIATTWAISASAESNCNNIISTFQSKFPNS